MNKLKKTIFYLKKYPFLSSKIFCFVLFGSFFEMFNIGMLVPIFRAMLDNKEVFAGIPVLSRFETVFTGWNRADIISVLLISFFILFAMKSLIFYLCNLSISKQRFLLTRDLQLDFFHHLMECKIHFFDSMKSGYLVNSLYNESTKIGDFMNGVLRIAAGGARLVVYIIVLSLISWKLTILAAVVLLLIFVPIEKILKQLYKIGKRVNAAVADLNFRVLENLSAIRIIKISGTKSYEEDRFRKVADSLYSYNYRALKRTQFIEPVTETIFLSMLVFVLVAVLKTKSIEMGTMMPFAFTYVYVALRTMRETKVFNGFRAECASNLGAFDSYEELLDTAKKEVMKNGTIQMKKFSREIDFNDVYLSYDGVREILRGVTCSIPMAKTTAIVGLSGAGKTTLVNLILRFYDVTGGSITVDGIDLKNLDLVLWRRKIGVVSQDVFIFNASARENICYGHFDVPEEEIIKASQVAEIDEFIKGLPRGYDSIFGERGIKLSGGQKQRLSIARAIIHNPEILIFDEATSSLDTKTEQVIQRAINKLAQSRTVISIAHRLSSVLSADNIIVIDKGKVVEQGTHEKLLNLDGHYAELYEIQFGAKNG